MSLTKEDLKALSDLIDMKFDEQNKIIDKRFDEQDEKFNQRFDEQDEKFNQRFDEQDKKFNQRFDEQDKKFNQRFDEQDQKSNNRFDEQDKKFDAKLSNLKTELKQDFKDMLTDNNLLIAEHVQRVVSESEERLSKEIKEIKSVTADNCYNIVTLKNKIS